MAAVWEEKERTGSEGERLRRGKRGTRGNDERKREEEELPGDREPGRWTETSPKQGRRDPG